MWEKWVIWKYMNLGMHWLWSEYDQYKDRTWFYVYYYNWRHCMSFFTLKILLKIKIQHILFMISIFFGSKWSKIWKMWNLYGYLIAHHDINLSDITTSLEIIFQKLSEDNACHVWVQNYFFLMSYIYFPSSRLIIKSLILIKVIFLKIHELGYALIMK